MREGWKYKKLGEVGKVVTGSTPSTKDAENYASNDYCFVKPSDFEKDGVSIISNTEFHISQKAFEASRKLPKGSVLTTCIGIIGKVGVLKTDATCNQQINAIIPSSEIDSKYLALAILSIRSVLETKANAPVVPIINKGDFSSVSIPVPPLSEQQRIVSELDLLTSIIDKQKAQLKELDNLAQSIFYDMFGDPVENEKGWEVVPFTMVGEFARGVSKFRPRNAPELLGGTMPLIQTGEIANSGMYITSYSNTYSELGVSQSKVWKAGTICITIAANIGKCSIMTFDACFPDSVVGFSSNSKVTKEFVYFIFLSLQEFLERNAPGVAQKNINLQILNSLTIPLPPLLLQQAFSAKIEAIEQQKQRISQSIAETQKLFDYTMDKYFG